MSEPEANFKWEVLLDDTEWNRTESLHDLLGAEPSASSMQHRAWSARLWVVAGLSMFVVLVAGIPLWHAANAGADRIEGEIGQTIDKETRSWQTESPVVASSLVDDEADAIRQGRRRQEATCSGTLSRAATAGEHAEIDINLQSSDLAMVAMIVQGPNGTHHREMYYYVDENGNDGVLRPLHSLAFWGSKQTIETAHFRIDFRQRDACAVEGTATRLDRFYAQLRQDADLPPNQEKLVVEVKPETPNQLRYLQFTENRLVVPSPLLLQVPVGLSDEEILTKSIINPLASHVLAEARQQAEIQREWRFMLRGIQLWQAYVGSETFDPWYRDIVAWLYADGRGGQTWYRTATTEDLRRFCREYQIWRDALPTDLAPPRLCMKSNRLPSLPFMATAPAHLAALLDIAKWNESAGMTWTDEWPRTVASATVIDYLAYTYGREQLPTLIAGFRTYDSWEDLVPVVLGIQAQELESGWRAYMATQTRVGARGE